MYATVKTLSILALAGSALAAPSNVERRGAWGGWSGNWGNWGNHGGNSASTPAAAAATPWTNWASTATVYVSGNAPPTPAPAAPSPAAPSVTAAPSAPPAGGQFYGAPSAPPSAPAPAAPSSAPASSGGSNDGSWQSVVTEWRAKGGLSVLKFDDTLTANAQKTADDSVGGLHHELNPGSMAQVLAPGNANDFEHVYVGGWLCEMPNLPGLDGICATQSQGWSYEGQTGHAEILTSPSYSKIGCALGGSTGVWACDLA